MRYMIFLILFLGISVSNCSKDGPGFPFSPIGNTLGIKLVAIPPGTFRMGLETISDVDSIYIRPMLPVHEVTLDGFEMSATEITQRQYSFVVGSNPSWKVGQNLPVNYVSWNEAIHFCNRLSSLYHLPNCYNESTGACDFTKNGFRLPTEAKWEYACRAGTTTLYYSGNSRSDLERAGWYDGSENITIHEVSKKEPNAWGLYDLHGNVREWCNGQYGPYSAPNALSIFHTHFGLV